MNDHQKAKNRGSRKFWLIRNGNLFVKIPFKGDSSGLVIRLLKRLTVTQKIIEVIFFVMFNYSKINSLRLKNIEKMQLLLQCFAGLFEANLTDLGYVLSFFTAQAIPLTHDSNSLRCFALTWT